MYVVDSILASASTSRPWETLRPMQFRRKGVNSRRRKRVGEGVFAKSNLNSDAFGSIDFGVGDCVGLYYCACIHLHFTGWF